jgi:hypothetical protein
MSLDFFRNLSGFTDFFDAAKLRYYAPAPQDWVILIADVEDSTKAIETGRYKEVNMVGAACITAVVNTLRDISIPYVFGGDGATILVPASHKQAALTALHAIKTMARQAYDLGLRVGAVEVSEVTRRGKSMLVGKYVMSTGASLAMFKGGGTQLAEQLVKSGSFVAEGNGAADAAMTEGLSCRWQPIRPENEVIISLLVLETDAGHSAHIYQDITQFLSDTLKGPANPVHLSTMRYGWPGMKHLRSARIVWQAGKSAWNYGAITLLFNMLNRFNIILKSFDVTRYRMDMVANSDFRKFDDMLRMVVDCSKAQAQAIATYLENLRAGGLVRYGMHLSDTALMTCFVSNTQSDGHVHFIDGGDGGYAMAAQQLKSQM